jgi:hypothetical protein
MDAAWVRSGKSFDVAMAIPKIHPIASKGDGRGYPRRFGPEADYWILEALQPRLLGCSAVLFRRSRHGRRAGRLRAALGRRQRRLMPQLRIVRTRSATCAARSR